MAAAVIIVSRFSIAFRGALPSKEWIDYRFDLLKDITLPSLRQQTAQNFVWVIATAPTWHSYVSELFRSITLPNSSIKIISTWPNAEVKSCGLGGGVKPEDLQDIHPGAETFITFRLDTDDALASKAIERVLEAEANVAEEEVLFNLSRGIQLNWTTGEMFYLNFTPHHQGPYLAIKNNSRDRMLFTGEGHRQSRRFVKRVVDIPEVNWLQVVHEKNIANRIRADRLIYQRCVTQLLSVGSTLLPSLKRYNRSNTTSVPAHLRESLLTEFNVGRLDQVEILRVMSCF